MASSRSSNLFRSNRRSASTGADDILSHPHRRGISEILPLAEAHHNNLQPAESSDLSRSRSITPSSSMQTQGMATMRGMERLEKRRTMEERNFMRSKARSQNLNPPVDLRLLDYVLPCDENLVCPICRCPYVDPVVLNECDHCFCRDCIRQTWTTSAAYNPLGARGNCPSCRTPAKLSARSATSKILVNILDDLMVRCPKSEDGCKIEVKRAEVQDHISIYCGYAAVECPADECGLTMRRKDAPQGCLHFGVSCLACHQEMQKCHLETHWHSQCPDRVIVCGPCQASVYLRDLAEHNHRLCPAVSIRCPGNTLGCDFRGKKERTGVHAKECTLAKLAPIINTQQKKLDEQDATQKQMSRKLEILEEGFTRMHELMYPITFSPEQSRDDASPRSEPQGRSETDLELPSPPAGPVGAESHAAAFIRAHRPNEPTSRALESRSSDLAGPFPDFDWALPFPPPAANGPYVSPLHHMLSMHESLRDEMSRVSTALQELDGRHSMQILNENMRTREEITYMGAQIAGMSRQVHWLTSAQLQRESRGTAPGTAAPNGDMAAAGTSVGAAISSAVQNATRIVNASREGAAMRRRSSEEGRTKL